MKVQYAVLYSAASEAVYGPELVAPERFTRLVDAHFHAGPIATRQGFEYEVMRATPSGWRSRQGETAVEVIRRRWQ